MIAKNVWKNVVEIECELELSEDVMKCIDDKVDFLNRQEQKIKSFINLYIANQIVININEEIAAEGKVILSDDTELTSPITTKQVEEAMYPLYFLMDHESELLIDFDTKPNYLQGHLATLVVKQNNTLHFGGING